jgi:branched-chain amino acid transport system substrate-binding protein
MRPAGTVTFLFTDIEGSTRLLQRLGRAGYGQLLAEHQRILRDVFARHGGHEVDTQGDAFFVAFATASEAVAAAADAQRALATHTWPEGAELRVRMGLHTGEALLDEAIYVGVAVHRAQRVSAAGHGGQVLLSGATSEMVEEELPPGVGVRDLGLQRLKDLDRPTRLFQLEIEGLPSDFPPLRTEDEPAAGPLRRRLLGRPRLAAAAAAALVVAIGAGAAALLLRGGGEPAAAAGSDALVRIDLAGGVTDRIPVGATPAAVAVGKSSVWVLNSDDQTISEVDADSHEATAFGIGATPTDLALGAGFLWVGRGERLRGTQAAGPIATGLAQVETETRTERDRVPLPRRGGSVSNLVDYHIAVTDDAVWAINPDFTISRIDPVTLDRKVIPSYRARAIAAAGDEVWVLGEDGTVAQINPATNKVGRPIELRATLLGALAVGDGSVWVTAPPDGALWRIERGAPPSSIPVGEGAYAVTVGGGSVWVANPLRGTVSEIDPDTGSVERTIPVGGAPRAIAVGEGALWAAVTGTGGAVTAGAARVEGALPRTFCENVVSGGGGAPDYLIASDLPLQGGVRLSAIQMAQAIEYVVRKRGFRAGPHRVGYQSCDDSIARTGIFDLDKCAENARQYERNRKVIGIVGTLNSPCALEQVPILSKAGLAMISPANSAIGLTRLGPGVPPDLLSELYPTGRRNYFRVYPTDDYEGAALAVLARQLGARRVVAVHDGDRFFSAPLLESFRIAAGRVGLDVRRVLRWDPSERSYRTLARRVARERPQAVFLSGLLDTNGGRVIRDLRAVLGPDVKMLATSGFTPVPFLFERAGPAAKGVYISALGLTPQQLGPAAQRFVKEFGATQGGAEVEPFSVFAAQAAEVLLDAIARSDGTRRSVIEELFATRVRNGILGSFRFDRNGDTTLNPVTILRAEEPGGRTTIMSVEGAAIDRVLTPSPNLVRG